jgi:hypothetical protein
VTLMLTAASTAPTWTWRRSRRSSAPDGEEPGRVAQGDPARPGPAGDDRDRAAFTTWPCRPRSRSPPRRSRRCSWPPRRWTRRGPVRRGRQVPHALGRFAGWGRSSTRPRSSIRPSGSGSGSRRWWRRSNG